MKTKRIPFDLEKAKAGAKVVTRNGHKVDTIRFDGRNYYPISGWIRALQLIGDSDEYASFTEEGYYISSNNEDCRDLFIEEDVEEDDNYNPYKEVVKSISDMVERYSDANSDLQDFYDNVKVKCREAVEYDKKWCNNQDEKPADNKPKFQKGNWVIDKQGTVHQIANVIENVTNHTYGYDVVGGGYFNENVEGIRFWTIQDARNGIVLACDTCIVLFKEIDGLNIKCHCTYHFMDTPMFFVDTLQNKTAFYPATKEQYDLLFQKIKEEGYQWDSERKELKKIKYRDDMAEKEVKQKSSFNEFGFRRMTNQELSWWLREHPEEHRELKMSVDDPIIDSLYYYDNETNETVNKDIIIRRNGGEWEEPLINIK